MDTLSPRTIVGEGTPESVWQDWWRRHPLPAATTAQIVDAGRALHVVAPHPDDEILGCAGIMRQAARLGASIHLWAVTDGEASHPDSPRWPVAQLADERTRESEWALHRLRVPATRYRLRVPDGGVEPQEDWLAARLARCLSPGDTVIAPWQLDGHPDHEAVSRASRHAADASGCTFLEVPIWGWHWADPGRGDFPAERAIAIALDADDQGAKRDAIQTFRTQLDADASTGRAPILPDFALARALRDIEVLLR